MNEIITGLLATLHFATRPAIRPPDSRVVLLSTDNIAVKVSVETEITLLVMGGRGGRGMFYT